MQKAEKLILFVLQIAMLLQITIAQCELRLCSYFQDYVVRVKYFVYFIS